MDILVRRAGADDAAEIASVTKEAFKKYARTAGLDTVDALSETYEQVVSDIENKYVFAAVIDDRIVGSLRIKTDAVAGTGYLSRFGVSGGHRNSGVGRALMERVDREMPGLGVTRLYLHTASKAAPLMRFYYGRGFYVESTSADKGYIRALMVKNY